jgi:hypothetical protein
MNRRTFLKAAVAGLAGAGVARRAEAGTEYFTPRTFLEAAGIDPDGPRGRELLRVSAPKWVTGPHSQWAQQVVGGELDGQVFQMRRD